MRNTNRDETLKKNYIQKYQFLVQEYEQVKAKKHRHFRFVKEFYAFHGTCAQTFLKYYSRYKQRHDVDAFLPQKRGPKWRTRRTDEAIEKRVVAERAKGTNRYEIHQVLRNTLKDKTPSPSCIYNIMKRYGVNRLKPVMIEEKRRIMKTRAGELGHIDCHYLSKDLIASESKRRYLVCVIDAYTRLSWIEIVDDIKALTVMFAVMRCFNQLSSRYGIEFEEILTDNGPEFGPKQSSKKEVHPFERLLMEMGVKHRYTKPYRPQTNGKVERLWRTLNEDLIEGTYFDDKAHFEKELNDYLLYYNHARPHQGIAGKIPANMIENPSTN
jgi:hypothetical protein